MCTQRERRATLKSELTWASPTLVLSLIAPYAFLHVCSVPICPLTPFGSLLFLLPTIYLKNRNPKFSQFSLSTSIYAAFEREKKCVVNVRSCGEMAFDAFGRVAFRGPFRSVMMMMIC